MSKRCYAALLFVVCFSTSVLAEQNADKKAKIVFISGNPSHGRMHHEHRAGNMILAKALNDSGLNVEAKLVPQPVGTLFLPIAGLQQMIQQLNETARRMQDQQAAQTGAVEGASDARAADEALNNL